MSPMPEYSDEDSSPIKINNVINIPCLIGTNISLKEEVNTNLQMEIAKESKIVQEQDNGDNQETNSVKENGNSVENGLRNDNQSEVGLELTESLSVRNIIIKKK